MREGEREAIRRAPAVGGVLSLQVVGQFLDCDPVGAGERDLPLGRGPLAQLEDRFASWALSVFVLSRTMRPLASRYLIQITALGTSTPAALRFFRV